MRLNLEKGVVDCVRLRAVPATIFVLIISHHHQQRSLRLFNTTTRPTTDLSQCRYLDAPERSRSFVLRDPNTEE